MLKIKVIAIRFLKGFIAGGVSSVVALLTAGSVPTDSNQLFTALAIAFATGGLLAVEKMLGWQNAPIN